MKDIKYYPLVSDIHDNIRWYQGSLKKLGDQLPAVRRELWTWQDGTEQYATAAAQLADFSSQIQGLKKKIAHMHALLKNTDVLRRDCIVRDVTDIVTDMLPSIRGTPHDVQGRISRDAAAYTDTEYDYEYFAKSYGHPKKIYSVLVAVHRDWDKTVQAQGLATAGGMLTLSAKPVKAKKALRPALDLAASMDVDLFEASWMALRRYGYQVHTEEGFIAVARNGSRTVCHNADPLQAVKGLRRKIQKIAA